jgi:hypothetical protein
MPMKKDVLLMTVFLSIILLSYTLENANVGTAKANPIHKWRFDASPTITIQSPQNNKTYSSDNALLVFNLTKPTANLGGYPYSNNWYDPIKGSNDGDDFGNRVVNATYYIDGQPSNVSIEVNSHLLEPFNYSLPIKGLTDGNHSLQIHLFCDGVEGLVWMAGGNLCYCNYYSYSQVVNFTVGSSDAVTFTTNPLNEVTVAIISVTVAIVCIVIGLLLFRRHRKTSNL